MKKAIRAFGVAESFRKELGSKSILAGIVMRGDLIIDGVMLGSCTVGGVDSTEKILEMWRKLNRDDINVILLNGCVISWFNVINLSRLYKETDTPVICVTYEASEGIDDYFKRYFPDDWMERLRVHKENGERREITLKTGYRVFVRSLGVGEKQARQVLNIFTLHGRLAEPLRVAKQLSRSVLMLETDPS
ncbi:MAG TPA: DUF99 family protein [Candidatus Caldiarchaeum subterraneum]|uniref:UPF0215 protein EYH45_01875 n=1 Tax=Caldiarchaeum subterraneum TaxID=311458 RepID=A0A833E9K9_CALS0|nr:DUF99 family protein [Candidatus Caldarchaeum subterraneum]